MIHVELYGGPLDGLTTSLKVDTPLETPRQIRHWVNALDKARSFQGQPAALSARPYELYERDRECPVTNLAGRLRYDWVADPFAHQDDGAQTDEPDEKHPGRGGW
jgi:hypothetical protein